MLITFQKESVYGSINRDYLIVWLSSFNKNTSSLSLGIEKILLRRAVNDVLNSKYTSKYYNVGERQFISLENKAYFLVSEEEFLLEIVLRLRKCFPGMTT